VATDADGDPGGSLRRGWRRLAGAVSWTPPTSTELGTVAKSGLAAGLAWWVALVLTDVPDPVLASFTAIVIVQVSVRASVRTALERSLAVVLGVLVALGVGDALELTTLTVALLVALSLGVAQLLLRLPPPAARQVPISLLVVLSSVTASQESLGADRAVGTLLGAGVGVAVSLLLPASRLVDGRQTLERLGEGTGALLDAMGAALGQEWSTEQSREWRRTARTVRDRLVDQAREAVGNAPDSARWNVRDRRHLGTLTRYEVALGVLERTAIGTWVVARGLDDHARLDGTSHPPMPSMGALLTAMAGAVRALVGDVLRGSTDLAPALEEVRLRRARCVRGASRRAHLALGDDDPTIEGEWLGYVALLAQVDRMTADLAAHATA
jgi:hypothetical protein